MSRRPMSQEDGALVRKYASALRNVVLDEERLGTPGMNKVIKRLLAEAEAQKKGHN